VRLITRSISYRRCLLIAIHIDTGTPTTPALLRRSPTTGWTPPNSTSPMANAHSPAAATATA